MKRSSSDIPSSPISSESEDFKPNLTPPPPAKSNKKARERDPTTPNPKKVKKDSAINGEWTPEKKGLFMDRIIAAGYKASNIGELANQYQFGMSETQLKNQLNLGRKGSLRDKAVQGAKGGA